MHLENIVLDAVDPGLVGRFWEAVLGGERLSEAPDGFETRVALPGGPVIDLCVQPVPAPPSEPLRLHLDLLGGDRQLELVDRFLGLGATRLDISQGEVPWVVLADPEGNPFCVMEHRDVYRDTGPIAALPLHSADPGRDAGFWSWLTGWTLADGVAPFSLRHPSWRGPLLELCPESASKSAAKNRVHLDVRLDPGDDADAVSAGIAARGGRELDHGWGELLWRVYTDPSGNELCVLPAVT